MDKLKEIQRLAAGACGRGRGHAGGGTFTLLAAEKPEHGYLGVSVQSLDSAEREKLGVKNGVEVITVEKESAAAKAGIKEDDIIQLVNGEKIRDPQDLVDIIGELAPGAEGQDRPLA